MTRFKRLSQEGIPSAMAKAERYRLLNQPWAAESICLDVLEVDPENQDAVVLLLLCLTDQFHHEAGTRAARARELLPRLTQEYRRAYYAGVIAERRATALLDADTHGANEMAGRLLEEAMASYERAEALRPTGNDESLLRWNTCARMLAAHPELTHRSEERPAPIIGE